MSEEQALWSPSQKTAFAFVRRAVSDGMSGRAGIKAFRDGGGHIGNAAWFSLYKSAFNMDGWKETIKQVPETYNVRENMFTHTDFDFREQYVVQMKVSGYSEELKQRVTKWVTVESDHIMTKREWRWAAQDAVDAGIRSPIFLIDRITEWEAMKRDPWRDEV